MNRQVEFYLSIQNEADSQGQNQAILRALAKEMSNFDAEISEVSAEAAPLDMLTKGEDSSGILDIKIDLDALRSLGRWIYERLTPGVKVTLKHKESEFTFEGRNTQELNEVLGQFEGFIDAVEGKN